MGGGTEGKGGKIFHTQLVPKHSMINDQLGERLPFPTILLQGLSRKLCVLFIFQQKIFVEYDEYDVGY